MTRLWPALIVLAVGMVGAQQPTRPFTSEAELVVVPAVVVDSRGQTVAGLRVDDFDVLEDGRPVQLSTFVPAGTGAAEDREEDRFVVLLLDDLASTPELAWQIKDIAARFATRMGPRDVVTVVGLNGDSSISSSNSVDVRSAINRFRPFGRSILTSRQLQTHALRTVADLCRQMAKAEHPRKVLVAIGATGLFNPYTDALEFDDGPWSDAVHEAARQNVSVYLIEPLGGRNVVSRTAPAGAWGLAAETGGEAFLRSNDFERAVTRIWRESASYYLLGYAPAQKDGRTHTIEVRVKRPDVTVRARRARE